jgi:hypothetical protein
MYTVSLGRLSLQAPRQRLAVVCTSSSARIQTRLHHALGTLRHESADKLQGYRDLKARGPSAVLSYNRSFPTLSARHCLHSASTSPEHETNTM